MVQHELKIGQIIYDDYSDCWGKIKLINGKAEDAIVSTGEEIITFEHLETKEIRKECSWLIYPLVEGRTFQGENVCHEINRDIYETKMKYEYYSPLRKENCFEFELDK